MFLRLLILCIFLFSSPLFAGEKLLVFAAASQAEAMEEIGDVFETQCECELVFSFAASSVLARQIEAGAEAELFLSASPEWINWLDERKKVLSSKAFISNRLAILTHGEMPVSPEILKHGRFSMADPRSVPAGVYARQALVMLEKWEQVKQNAVYTENVRIALTLVMRGDLNAGIVYKSDIEQLPPDAKFSRYLFPETSHAPIEYVAGVLKENQLARDFVEFLQSAQAQNIFERLGFLPLSAKTAE